MAYKFQVGNATLAGNIVLGGDASLSGSLVSTAIDDSTAANVVAQIDNGEIGAAKIGLADGKLLIGDGAGNAAPQTMSGDVTMSNAGVVTIANAAVEAAMMAANAIATGNIQDDAVDADKLAADAVVYDSLADAALGTVAENSSTKLVNSANIKTYVDSVAQGLDIKDSVKAASTANLDLNGTETIDGVSILAGDRVLVKDQDAGTQNGIYVCAAGAWSRASDFAVGEDEAGAFTFVEQGTVSADTGWVCTNNKGGGVVGTDALAFSQFSGAGSITAGTGLSKSGSTLNIDVDELTLLNAAPNMSQDHFIVSDNGAEKKVTMQKVSDAAYGGVSGDIQIAAGGAATIQAGAVEGSMLNANVTQDSNGLEIDTSRLKVKVVAGATGGLALEAGGLKIAAGGVSDAMLGGSIANGKLANSAMSIAGQSVSLGGSISAAVIAGAIDSEDMALTSLTNIQMQNNADYSILDIGSNTLSIGNSGGSVKSLGKLEGQLIEDHQTFTANGTISIVKPYVIATRQGSDITLTLPACSGNAGARLLIKAKGAGAGNVIISRAGSDTIDGANSITLESAYAAVQLFCTGTEWLVW